MKKLLGIGALALALVAVSAPKASAWTNFHFGIGLDISYQAGNNCFLWGLWRNGPAGNETPLGPCFGCCPGYPGCFGYGAAFAGPVYGGPIYADPAYAGAPAGMNGQNSNWVAPPPNPQPPTNKDKKKNSNEPTATTVPASYYQPVGSYPTAPYSYGAYTQPGYYGNGYFQAPSYWYGR
jgi:hypothetical protein